MGEDKKPSKQRTDSWFEKLRDWIAKTISIFVAAIFFLFGAGAVYGAFFAANPLFILVPFALGLLAYYSRDFAIIILALVLLSVFLFPL